MPGGCIPIYKLYGCVPLILKGKGFSVPVVHTHQAPHDDVIFMKSSVKNLQNLYIICIIIKCA